MINLKNEKRKLSLSGASSEKQKESSLILRKAKFQAIFKFVLSSASGGAGGGKYNRISAFVSMLVLLIRRSREKFFKKNFRDDSFSFLASPKDSLHRHPERSEGSIMNNIKDWILRFAKAQLRMTFFALIFTLIATAKSQAECGKTASAVGTDDNGNYCGICNDSGTCKWKLNSSGELNVYAADGAQNVAIKDYSRIDAGRGKDDYPNWYKTTAPWGGLGATSLVIGDNITSVGQWAFVGESRITEISGMNDLKSIGYVGFHVMSGVQSLEIPERLTYVGASAFQAMYNLKILILPDNLNTKNWSQTAFNYIPSLSGFTLYCQGEMEKCQAAMAKYIPTSEGGTCTSNCLTNATFAPAAETQCTGSSYYWSGRSCNNKKNGIICTDNWKRNENFCNRIQYTPAEATEVLNDDNTNEVTITFKK